MINNQSFEDMSVKDKLYQVLLEEIHAYTYLAETVKQKQEAIIKNELESLENLTGVERLLVNKVELLLQTRERYLQKLTDKKQSNITLRLGEFINGIPEEEQARWISLEQRIHRTVEKIRRLNLENQQLIRSSLNYIHGMVEMLYPHEKDGGFYNKTGKEDAKVSSKPILNCNA